MLIACETTHGNVEFKRIHTRSDACFRTAKSIYGNHQVQVPRLRPDLCHNFRFALVWQFVCAALLVTHSCSPGIFKHLLSIKTSDNTDHPDVQPPITQEATKVACRLVDGQWVIEAPIAAASPSSSQTWRELMGYGGNSDSSISNAANGEIVAGC